MFPVLTKCYDFVKSFSQAVTGKLLEEDKTKWRKNKKASVYVIEKCYGHTG